MADENTAPAGELVVVEIDGAPFAVGPETTVAAALVLRYGVRGTRKSVRGQPRAALCGMGVCQECRVAIDDRPHALACQTTCRNGMTVRTEATLS